MKAEHDPLASHIFISPRNYRNANDTKGGKRREINARLSFNTACELGFRGSLDEWERLMGAVAHRWCMPYEVRRVKIIATSICFSAS